LRWGGAPAVYVEYHSSALRRHARIPQELLGADAFLLAATNTIMRQVYYAAPAAHEFPVVYRQLATDIAKPVKPMSHANTMLHVVVP
jgi:hypothetical protein